MSKDKENKEPKKNKLNLLDELAKTLPLVSEKEYETKTEPIPSGSLSLDLAIGIGGYPRGAIIDIFGVESAGKSLLSIMAIAQVQKMGGVAVVWDAERSYSKNLEWMRINGVDTSKLRFLKLRSDQGAEIGLDAIEQICKNNAADLVVIDSVPSLIPQKALERDLTEEARLGARAAMLTSALPRLAAICDESKTSIICINQMRCIPLNALISTQRGIIYASEVKVGDKIMCGNNFKTVKNIVRTGKVKGYQLITQHGGELIISENHKQPVFEKGHMEIKQGKDIKYGDCLIIPIQEVCSIPEKAELIKVEVDGKQIAIDENWAFVLGAVVFNAKKDENGYLVFENKYENKVLAEIKNAFDKIIPNFIDVNLPRIIFKNPEVIRIIEKLLQDLNNPVIPIEIVKSRRSVVISYLRGLFCSFAPKKAELSIKLTERISNKFIVSLLEMLHALGIPAWIKPSWGLEKSKYLRISGRWVIKFNEIVGFVSEYGQIAIENNKVKMANFPTYTDRVHYMACGQLMKVLEPYKEIKYKHYRAFYESFQKRHNKLKSDVLVLLDELRMPYFDKELIRNSMFDPVVLINPIEFEGVDFEVDSDSLFTCQRYLTHNSNIGASLYQSPEKETSIFALKHFSSLRIKVRKASKSVIENGVPVGHRVHVEIVKNKVSAPYKQAEFFINYYKGVDNYMELAEILTGNGLAKLSGGWIQYEGNKYHGINEFAATLKNNKEMFNKALHKIKSININTFGIKTEEEVSLEDITENLDI